MQFLLKEQLYIKTIVRLEDERKKLKDGDPCPLCGSRNHPFALGNIPEMDENEIKVSKLNAFIESCEEIEKKAGAIEGELKQASQENAGAEKELISIKNEIRIIEDRLKRTEQDMEDLKKETIDTTNDLMTDFKVFGIDTLNRSDDIHEALRTLEELYKKWISNNELKAEIKDEAEKLKMLAAGSAAEIKTRDKSLAEKIQARDEIKKQLSDCMTERSDLFGNKCPDQEEALFLKKISESEQREKELTQACKTCQTALMTAETELASLEESSANLVPKLEKLENEFIDGLNTHGFKDENDFSQARLSSEEYNRLTEKEANLNQLETEIKARADDRASKLDIQRTLNRTELTLEELDTSKKVFEEKTQAINNELTEVRIKLAENSSAKKRLQEKTGLIEKQQKECDRWNRLHSLIGSENGKKFRNFAQGLTFEMMVSHANQELKKMSDRYLLVRDFSSPLELNVLDNYQAGEIRSVKNLSGGESFIVSLTLALGLSRMASHKVKVDSLFLDEGFGTLDEESLETALETLANLNQEGKLIGIISHIAALKERIGTQISVSPASGGKSTIKGPGCRRK
jgi:exonuclease SbcC